MEATGVASTRDNNEAKQYHNLGRTVEISDNIKLNDIGVGGPHHVSLKLSGLFKRWVEYP